MSEKWIKWSDLAFWTSLLKNKCSALLCIVIYNIEQIDRYESYY